MRLYLSFQCPIRDGANVANGAKNNDRFYVVFVRRFLRKKSRSGGRPETEGGCGLWKRREAELGWGDEQLQAS